ncbi:hypothetical protein EV714DRAFT_276644 [Schizophyllum commune]
MPTSSPFGLPLAQSSTCRHVITASDLFGPHEYADDVAPAEERSRSSQSHTCKTNLLEDTHLPLVLDHPNAIALLSLPVIASLQVLSQDRRLIQRDELGLELWISMSPCLFRPTPVLALAFKHSLSHHFERNLAHFLKRVYTLKLMITFLNLILTLKRTTPTR